MQCKVCGRDYPTKYYFFNQNPDFPCIYCAKDFGLYGCELEESLDDLTCVTNPDKWFTQLENNNIRLIHPLKEFVKRIHAHLINEDYVKISVRPHKIIFKTTKLPYKFSLFIMALMLGLLAFLFVQYPKYSYIIIGLLLFTLFSYYFRLKEIKYSEKQVEVDFERKEIFFLPVGDPEQARVINFSEIKEFEKESISDRFRPMIIGEIIAYLKNDVRIRLLGFGNTELFKTVFKFLQENFNPDGENELTDPQE